MLAWLIEFVMFVRTFMEFCSGKQPRERLVLNAVVYVYNHVCELTLLYLIIVKVREKNEMLYIDSFLFFIKPWLFFSFKLFNNLLFVPSVAFLHSFMFVSVSVRLN